MPSFNQPGAIFKTMASLSKNATLLVKQLFKGGQKETRIAAGVMRTILSDITKIYFENKKASGKGVLVFNPENPQKSKYLTSKDIDRDLAFAEEMMHKDACRMFKKIIDFIEKQEDEDLALIAMIQPEGVTLHLIDPEQVDKRIKEFSRGLIL